MAGLTTISVFLAGLGLPKRVADSAYFVPSYSDQTITCCHKLMTSQVIAIDEMPGHVPDSLEVVGTNEEKAVSQNTRPAAPVHPVLGQSRDARR